MIEILLVVAKAKYNKQLVGENRQVVTLEIAVCDEDTVHYSLKFAYSVVRNI